MPTKDPVLSVRLPDDLDARLNKCAESLDLSKNDIARHAIRAAVATTRDGRTLQKWVFVAMEKPVVGQFENEL